MRVFVDGVGVCGPGLVGWADSALVLAGTRPYRAEPFVSPKIDLLPAAERRRTSPSVKLVLAVGQEAVQHSQRAPDSLASVFSSSGGDGETIHAILTTLATSPLDVSPTKFHNSVHNAPSGYWAVAMGSRRPSTTLCAYDWSFAAGVVEAAVTVVADESPVLFVAHDIAYPEPLHSARPIESGFGVAMVLAPERSERSFAKIETELAADARLETPLSNSALERLRAGNPAARALPLLALLAGRRPGRVTLETPSRGSLLLHVETLGGGDES